MFVNTLIKCMLLLCYNILQSTTVAIAPYSVINNNTSWEPSISKYRKRLGIEYKYKPKYIPINHCRFLSEKDCEKDDIAAKRKIEKEKKERRRKLDSVRTGDSIKVLVLLCRFTDHVDRNLPSKEYWETIFNGPSSSSLTLPVGSIRDYFYYNSHYKYNVTFDVQDWETTVNTEAYYANNEYGLRGSNVMQEMAYPLLDNLYDSGYDFIPLDSDGWGDLDHLVIVHSGYPAEHGNPDDGCTNNDRNRIWSQGITASTNGWTSSDGIYTVSNYLLVGSFADGLCNGNPIEMGVIAHEYSHGFGLIDLYDEDEDEPVQFAIGGVGRFGLMSNVYGWNRNQMIPGHMNTFSKEVIGWVTPIEITQNGYYAIQPSEVSSQVYKISTQFPDGEYLLIENRQPLLFDQDWPTGGIVIYHIDNNVNGQLTRGYPGHPNWPTDHFQVHVLQKDGNYDIEQGNNLGDEGDFWVLGDKLSPGGSNPVTWPNTDGYSGGNRAETGIEIEVLTNSQYIMLFRVTGINPL